MGEVPLGLFTYPILQAADILIYKLVCLFIVDSLLYSELSLKGCHILSSGEHIIHLLRNSCSVVKFVSLFILLLNLLDCCLYCSIS